MVLPSGGSGFSLALPEAQRRASTLSQCPSRISLALDPEAWNEFFTGLFEVLAQAERKYQGRLNGVAR